MPEFPSLLATSGFYLELHLKDSVDAIDAYFMECQGFKTSQEIIEICEVTPQMWGKDGKSRGRMIRTKIPGNISYTNLTLRRGLTVSMTDLELVGSNPRRILGATAARWLLNSL